LIVTAFGLGGQALLEMKNKQKEAYDLINKAIDLGINYFDTATIYGPSREYYGKALKERRKSIILASKVKDRTYNGAKKELDEAFNLLNTNYIDIIHLHSIAYPQDLSALKKDGALQLLAEAKKAGKIGYIGFSGHYDPDLMYNFMDNYDFDTMLIATNPSIPEFDRSIQKALNKGMGVIAMKIMARGILPLYYPTDKLLHYSMKRAHVTIAGCTNEGDVERNVLAAAEYNPKENFLFYIPSKIRKQAAYFTKYYKEQPWPETYQPNWPNILYSKK
jgi:predicted aldo/keto reductase-like oxidoreductase